MKKRDYGPRWHGIRLSNASASVMGGWVFAAGILILATLRVSAGWFVMDAALLGIGIFGSVNLIRKIRR